MKIIELSSGGILVSLSAGDWRADVPGLEQVIRNFDSASYDADSREWWIAETHIDEFYQAKKCFIDDKLNPGQGELELS